MTEKEKAKELIDKFFPFVEAQTSHQQDSNAKQCALISCKELINATKYQAHIANAYTPIETTEYWQQVKTEIENYE
jgi:hypothetical protein